MAKWVQRFRPPCDSGPHRIACKALYRALLEQCPRIPLPSDLPPQGPVNPIKHLIRKGFRRRQYEGSPRLAVKALKIGYNAEELLRTAASGSQPALSQIHTLLRRLHTRRQESQQPPPPKREIPRVWPYPGAPKVLETRPLPLEKLSGNRRVPIVTQTNGYPFLRFKKPQSPFLSRVLRDKIMQKHNRFEKIGELDGHVENLGAWEGQWEMNVLNELRREGAGGEEWWKTVGGDWGRRDGWCKDARDARKEVWSRLDRDGKRAKEAGLKMVEIYKQEEEMWRQEREKRRHDKNVERRRRKEESMRES